MAFIVGSGTRSASGLGALHDHDVSPDPTVTPLQSPAIGVGTWSWGNQLLWGYRPERDDPILDQTFQRAVQVGFRFFDTADSYGTGRLAGRSEALLGRFAAALPEPLRGELVLATKLAPFPWRLGRHGLDAALAASRGRLQGQLRRVQLHWSTSRYAPWQEGPLLEGLADSVRAGAVAEIGLSNVGPVRLRELHRRLGERGVRLSSLQVQLSLLAPEPLRPGGVAEVCRELGVDLIAYSPLALGLLCCPPGVAPPRPGGLRGLLYRRLLPRIHPLRECIQEIAARRGASAAQVALNWCRAHGAMPIPGMRRVAQVEDAAAARRWSLSGAEREALDAETDRLGVRMPANPFQSA
jgi:pyridoxine 4-dehydrogenase